MLTRHNLGGLLCLTLLALALSSPLAPVKGSQVSNPSDWVSRPALLLSQEYVITLRQGVGGYYGGRDTYLDHWNPYLNYGSDQFLIVRSDGERSALGRWDLSLIPSHAEVISAELGLWVSNRSNSNPMTLAVYEVLRPWEEMEANWYSPRAGENWDIAGGNGPSDRSMVAVDSVVVNGVADKWYILNITSLVQKWVSHPETNYGYMLRGLPGAAVGYDFSSNQQTAVITPKGSAFGVLWGQEVRDGTKTFSRQPFLSPLRGHPRDPQRA